MSDLRTDNIEMPVTGWSTENSEALAESITETRLWLVTAEHAVARLCEGLRHLRDENVYWGIARRDGQPFKTWREFCETPAPDGLGLPVALADALISRSRRYGKDEGVFRALIEDGETLRELGEDGQ